MGSCPCELTIKDGKLGEWIAHCNFVTRQATLVTLTINMIRSFKPRGLKRLFEKGDRSKIYPLHVNKIRRVLATLEAAKTRDRLRRPGYRLHQLHGSVGGQFAIDVSANWRIVFRFEEGRAADIDLVDYIEQDE